ncbi:hypothetical protein [Evansella halocellulosilytica]|uniref:hypothetical protein n=1 Tax=Evansella halocellulosilytica TaxID=2011013 RepID=UPI000BB7304D|nr:hypothetical protein [Evansella halocellulosilytica]
MRLDCWMSESLKTLMKETCEGPSEKGSHYTSVDPDAGLFGTLRALTAQRVSEPQKMSKAPIVSHVYHTCYYLKVMNSQFTNKPMKYDDDDSWNVIEVNEEQWHEILEEFKREYDTFIEKIEVEEEWGEEKVQSALATLAHSAYHLGSLRQMVC